MRWTNKIGWAFGLACLLFSQDVLAQSANALALDDDSIRVNISGFTTVPGCSPTSITRFRNGANEGTSSHQNTTSSVDFHELAGGQFHFNITVCDANGLSEPDYVFLTTNSVTIAGAPTPIPGPTSQVQVNAGAGDNDLVVTWASTANATEYRLSSRSQTTADWQQGNGDNWSNWSAYSSQGNNLSKTFTGLAPAVYQYRVIACNAINQCSVPTISNAGIIDAPQFDGGDTYYLPNTKVRAIWTAPEGCLVLFEDLPNACQTTFSNAHALIQFTNPNHEKMYSQVFMANAMGKNVDIWFDDNGDCSSLNTLMTIGKIVIHETAPQRQEKTHD